MGDVEVHEGWEGVQRATERRFASICGFVGVFVQPFWIILDAVTQPAHVWNYVPLRLVMAGLCLTAWIGAHRLEDVAKIRWLVFAMYVGSAFLIALTVPAAGPYYAFYVSGFSLFLWGVGSMLSLPLGFAVAYQVSFLAVFGLAHLGGFSADSGQLIGSIAYLGTAAILAAGSTADRYRTERGAFVDRSARTRAQQEMVEAQLEVVEQRALREAREAFLRRMSHELRTPLNAILGYAEMVREECESAGLQVAVEDLDRVDDSGRRLLGLLSEMLDLTALELGEAPFHPSEFDVSTAIGPLVDELLAVGAAKGLSVHLRSSTGRVFLDRERLEQCVRALLTNAVKFTASGFVSVDVMLDDETLEIVVRDTGPGIDPAQVDRLFAPFEVGDGSTTRTADGSGLGLPVTRGLARGMGGDLTYSRESNGSAFHFVVPRFHAD